ncbi:MAG: hypothetical protein Q7J44_13535 [Pseudotabrizicola sp.]|uniref:hypothetical protein n=1 Tax=Pseudotabrizicola sp. TaxID=2939647 RepID=UPI00271D847D|nr:hypothetical protein [Pseudotabrizicola sp.]MDO9639555.1 hypothetical protein [Pseudotabrizicola sp.]
MFRTNVLMTAPVMAILMCGTAQAALTADQVWADLQAAAVSGGMKITVATEVPGDGELTLNGVTITPDGKPAIATISEVSIVEQDDGSVAFFPGEIRLENTGPGKVTITHDELSVSAFEDAGGLGYGFDADSLTVAVNIVEGANLFDGTFDLIAAGGRYTRGTDALGLEMSADQLVYNFTQKDPSLGIDSVSSSDTADLALTGELTLPEGINLMSLQDTPAFISAVRAGLGISFEATQGISTGEAVENNPMMPVSVAYTAAPGTTSVTANADVFDVSTTVEGLDLTLRPPMVPMPVTATTGAFGVGMAMPVTTGEEAGEYGLQITMENLVLDDAAWGMIDAGNVLEHGPLDVALDLGGLVKVDVLDLMLAGETGAPPASTPEMQSLDIRTLAIQALGAMATGTGSFTFDNSMVAMGGPPLPVGTADVRVEGGNKLIDGLLAMGVLTQEDAMGARMMMAMFGQPAGEDVLTSKIEAREGGSIFVNGQQIQ